MTNAIGSKINLNSNSDIALDFNNCIKDLLELEDVKKLDNFTQHLNTSRLSHSINVAYYSYTVCKIFGLDYKSAARAGILHDLFLYDWRTQKQPEGNHAKAHPIVALRTAEKNVKLNDIEKDCIIKHMWPLTFKAPKYKESFLLSCMDKYCTVLEVFYKIFEKFISIFKIRNISRNV